MTRSSDSLGDWVKKVKCLVMKAKRTNRIETSFRGYLRLLESTTTVGQDVVAFEHQDYDLFVQYSELLKNEGKGHNWDLIKKNVWDMYMGRPGTIFVIAPYKGSKVAGILMDPKGHTMGLDNSDIPIEKQDLDEFIKNLDDTARLVRDPSYRLNLHNLLMKLTAKSKLSMLKGEMEDEDD
jgi:hypothetical protein